MQETRTLEYPSQPFLVSNVDTNIAFGFIEEADIFIPNLGPIFTGPYSTIYKGTYQGLTVAVKVLLPLAGVSLHAMRRKVYRERIIWGNLDHPNLVRCYGFTDEGAILGRFGALIIPWCEYGSLDIFLNDHGEHLSVKERMRLCIEVTAGVDYLHNHNPTVIHGDLKPGNILIDHCWTAKICDFGLSKVLFQEGESGMTTTSDHTGTDRYLAYELVLSASAASLSFASDIWALGCVHLNILFSRIPYAERKTNRFGEVFSDIRAKIPPAARPKESAYESIRLWQILESCWLLDCNQRPTAEQVLEALRNAATIQDTERPAKIVTPEIIIDVHQNYPDLLGFDYAALTAVNALLETSITPTSSGSVNTSCPPTIGKIRNQVDMRKTIEEAMTDCGDDEDLRQAVRKCLECEEYKMGKMVPTELLKRLSEAVGVRSHFRCRFPGCGKVSIRTERTMEHARAHIGNHPYPCTRVQADGTVGCGATFLRKHDRNRHNNGPDVLTCEDCGAHIQGNNREHNLQRHRTYYCSVRKRAEGRNTLTFGTI